MATAEVPRIGETDATSVGAARLVHEDGGVAVWLSGEHDLTTKDLLSAALAEVTTLGSSKVVIDLTEAEFIDAATIGAIVSHHRQLGGGNRSLILRNPSRLSLRVIQVCGLASLVEGGAQRSVGPS